MQESSARPIKLLCYEEATTNCRKLWQRKFLLNLCIIRMSLLCVLAFWSIGKWQLAGYVKGDW